jgi:hypothetical protein
MAGPTPEITAKGSNFIGLLKALEALHGADARELVFAAMPEQIASPLRFGQVVVMGWYPVVWYAELHAAVDRCFHEGPNLARKLSHHATRADIGSIHRFIASMLSVETVFGQTHRLMSLYWKGGRIERLELAPGRARVRFEGWPGFTALIWEDLMGGMEAVLESCGATNGRCRASGRMDDAGTLEIDVRWS